MTTIRAWHNDPDLKAEAVATMRRHKEQDDLARGAYLLRGADSPSGFKGCFHGCLTTEKLAANAGMTTAEFLRSSESEAIDWHGQAERIWGIPASIGWLLDRTFEGRRDNWGDFAVAATEAIPVGADMTLVVDRWLLDMLTDKEFGTEAIYATRSPALRQAFRTVVTLLQQCIDGYQVPGSDWLAVQEGHGSAIWSLADYGRNGAPIDARIALQVLADEYQPQRGVVGYYAYMDHAEQRLLHHIATAPVPA